jgi:phosphohistidine phosphatase
MKSVILFRHGKSDWNADFGSDHERAINQRGVRSARRMGRFLAAIDQVPDLAVTSSAVRARTTLELAVEAGGWTCPVEVTDDLYNTHVDAVITQLRAGDDHLDSVLLTGHEPVWSELCGQLIGRANIRFPTAAMARIDFRAGEWRGVRAGAGTLVWHIPPRALEGCLDD